MSPLAREEATPTLSPHPKTSSYQLIEQMPQPPVEAPNIFKGFLMDDRLMEDWQYIPIDQAFPGP
jgi:hypothetical protein